LVCPDSFEDLRDRLRDVKGAIPVVTRSVLPEGKLRGIPPDWCDRLLAEKLVDALVVEADGAARKPVKAPEHWEPVVPEETTVFTAMVGLSCLGKPLDAETVFRPERVAAVTGLRLGSVIGPEVLCHLLGSDQGLLKGRPPLARAIAFLNQADVPGAAGPAMAVARGLIEGPARYERVVIGALRQPHATFEVWTEV
jgi:probable selenium-dependent hydroxylase accessory protein YqeC